MTQKRQGEERQVKPQVTEPSEAKRSNAAPNVTCLVVSSNHNPGMFPSCGVVTKGQPIGMTVQQRVVP